MIRINADTVVFSVPRVIFTLRGNSKSEEVIEALKKLSVNSAEQKYLVFSEPSEVAAHFESGVSPLAAVVLFDTPSSKAFTMATCSRPKDVSLIPPWSHGSHWAVKIHPRCSPEGCARQLVADFLRKFENSLNRGEFPWGKPRKKEAGPVSVRLPANTEEIIAGLNSGPDLTAAIANEECALELPSGSRVSWYRIAAEPLFVDEQAMTRITEVMQAFERISAKLVRERLDIHESLMAGVLMNGDQRLPGLYLFPPSECFSVARPDLHYCRNGVFASENDEMPGGFAELVHLDRVYGLNQDRWETCFNWLSGRGYLLFVVSHGWSRCYIPEMEWLVKHLRSKGYHVGFLSTARLDGVTITADGVFHEGERVGTIWRQFPIFETTDKLAELVVAAKEGLVRMLPEFAHFGNKAWFSIFRREEKFFREVLDAAAFKLLDEILPDSHLVTSEYSLPCQVAGERIENLQELLELPEEIRDKLVLKISGANPLSSRSYGVLMGVGLSKATWRRWIGERVETGQPFIIQRRLESSVTRVPVQNVKTGCPEFFGCRILLRPWSVNGKLVSAAAFAVPSDTTRVHGRVDMAVLPVQFES